MFTVLGLRKFCHFKFYRIHLKTKNYRKTHISEIKMTSFKDCVTFNNGCKMPCIGLGTYVAVGGEAEEAVKKSIDIGYRHIDTAAFYENEEEIGKGVLAKIKEGVIKREDMFITTKVWNNCHKEESVVKSCKESLARLNLGYIDLFLLHWPFAFKEGDDLLPRNEKGEIIGDDTDYLESWRGMEECVRQGLTRSIGVSNFNSEQLTRLLTAAKIKPVNNQVECSVNINQTNLINFCKKLDITVTGYSPIGAPGRKFSASASTAENILMNPCVLEIAKKYNKSPAQVAIRFVLQQGAVPIPKSVNEKRMKENIDIFDFTITEDEMEKLRASETGVRVAAFGEVKNHKYYPFSIPF